MKIQNSSTIKEIRTAGGLSLSEGFPSDLGNSVVPVINVNPKDYKTATVLGSLLGRATAGSGVVVLGAQTDEVFITGFMVSNVQDATSDNALIILQTTIGGVAQRIYSRRKASATAGVISDIVQLSKPIKIDLGATVTFTLTFSVGTSSSDILLYGYMTPVFESL